MGHNHEAINDAYSIDEVAWSGFFDEPDLDSLRLSSELQPYAVIADLEDAVIAEHGQLSRTDFQQSLATRSTLSASEQKVRNRQLAEQAAGGDLRAKWDLVLSNLNLIPFYVHRRTNGSQRCVDDQKDMISYGLEGLIKAAEVYDPVHGAEFSTYALLWIRGVVQRRMADEGRVIRLPAHRDQEFRRASAAESILSRTTTPTIGEIATKAEVVVRDLMDIRHMAEVLPLDGDEDVYDRTAPTTEELAIETVGFSADNSSNSLREIPGDGVGKILDLLTEKEAYVLCARLGLKGGEGLSLAEVGRQMGVTREAVRVVEARVYKLINGIPDLRQVIEDDKAIDKDTRLRFVSRKFNRHGRKRASSKGLDNSVESQLSLHEVPIPPRIEQHKEMAKDELELNDTSRHKSAWKAVVAEKALSQLLTEADSDESLKVARLSQILFNRIKAFGRPLTSKQLAGEIGVSPNLTYNVFSRTTPYAHSQTERKVVHEVTRLLVAELNDDSQLAKAVLLSMPIEISAFIDFFLVKTGSYRH